MSPLPIWRRQLTAALSSLLMRCAPVVLVCLAFLARALGALSHCARRCCPRRTPCTGSLSDCARRCFTPLPAAFFPTSFSFPALKKNILQVDFTCKQLTWQIQRMGSKSRSRAPPWAPTGRTPAAQHQRRNLGEISFELCLFRAHALRSTPQQQALCEGRPEQPRMT